VRQVVNQNSVKIPYKPPEITKTTAQMPKNVYIAWSILVI